MIAATMSTISSKCQKNFLNLNVFSLKFFQASSLLCRSSGNDHRSSLLAEPVETGDLIERMSNMTRFKNFASQRGEYRHQSLEFTEILADKGKCFSANIRKDIYRHETFVREPVGD